MEKNINDKFTEQINEIEKFKTMKNEFVTDMNNLKLSLELHKKEIINNENHENNENNENLIINNSNINESSDKVIFSKFFNKNINSNIINRYIYSNIVNNSINSNNNSNIINNNYINNRKEFKFHLNSRNINYKRILTKDKRNIPKELLKNINDINEYQNSEEKNNIIESLSNKRINSLHIERSKSFEKIPSDFIDENNELKIFQYKQKLNNNNNISNKDIIRNNYSISNIPNIKFKKVILPENLIKINLNQTSRNFLSKNKGLKMIQNNIHSIKLKKNINFNDNINNNGKNTNNTQKSNKNIKLANSNKTDTKKTNFQLNKNMSSFLIINEKSKNNRLKNLDSLKKNNLSYDGEKNLKDEQVQIGFGKTFNMKYKIRDVILMNSKSFKKTRKIEI